jgi:hypothetical protein
VSDITSFTKNSSLRLIFVRHGVSQSDFGALGGSIFVPMYVSAAIGTKWQRVNANQGH